MEYVVIQLLLACINLPAMIMSKKNVFSYLAFGFCIGCAVCSFINQLK